MSTTIDERTKITMYSLALVLPTIVTTVVFLTTLTHKTEANALQLTKHDILIDAQTLMLMDIRDRLIKIETNQGRNKRGE